MRKRTSAGIVALLLPGLTIVGSLVARADSSQENMAKLTVASDEYPEGQTAKARPDGIIRVSTGGDVKSLHVSLDGEALPDRSFAGMSGSRWTEVPLTPDDGWHRLVLTPVTSNGEEGAATTYEFGATSQRGVQAEEHAVGGHVVDAAGNPVAGRRIAVYSNAPSIAVGEQTQPLATAVTGEDGNWRATLSDLPPAVVSAGIENGGIVNLAATSLSGDQVGSVAFSVGLPHEPGIAQDANRTALAKAADESPIATMKLGTPEGAVTNAPAVNAAGDQCLDEWALVTDVVGNYTVFTIAGEAHSNRDGVASFTYSKTAGSKITAGISYSQGKTWGVNGSQSLGHSITWSSGFTGSRGHFGKQWRVPIHYQNWRVSQCQMIGGVRKKVYKYNMVVPVKVEPAVGGAVGSYGRDVSAADDIHHFLAAKYWWKIADDGFFSLDRNSSWNYANAASAFGFSVSSETTYSDSRKQQLSVGRDPYASHVFWSPQPFDQMKVFFAY